MAGIEDLGNDNGYIYIVDVDKTTIIKPLPNNEANARDIKVEGVKSASNGAKQKPYATITVATVTGVGTITSITVNAVEQIDISAPIAYTGATSTTALAALIVTAMNSWNKGVGGDYTAYSVGAVVYISGEIAIGSADNGLTPVVSTSGNSTYTITDVTGGSDSDALYNETYGYTFFLNADYNASGCTGATTATADSLTNAVEITGYIVPRSLNSSISILNEVIATGAISPTRSSTDTLIYIDTQAAAAADDLDTIVVSGFAEGDKITLRGLLAAQVTTVKDGTGNIELQGGVVFDTDDFETALVLQLKGSTWYEVSRTTQSIGAMADYRTAGYGFFGVDTFTTAVLAAGTTTYNGGTDSKYLELTGTVALGANATYALGTGVNGDEFILQLNAATTVGAFALSVFGVTLSAAQALRGGLVFHAKYVSAGWQVSVSSNLDPGIATPYLIPTELYAPLSVDVAAVEAILATEVITRRVSFEAGEECDNQITMYYPGTVVDIYFSVDKVIAGTDNGTITPKDDAGVAMTGGLITVTAASALDTVFGTAAAISANNTFIDGDVLNFTTAKTTKGGFGTLSIRVLKS